MNARILCAAIAVAAIFVASIVIGGTLVFVSVLLYRSLVQAGSPGLAVAALIVESCLIGGLLLLIAHLTVQRAFRWRGTAGMSSSPEHMIASELVRLTDGQPTKLAAASFGIGIALGLSPR
jgi:hypothetical protein